MKKFNKGDIVEIIGNIPFDLRNEKKPLIGTVTNIDGYYIMVRPKNKKWFAEFYPGELEHYIDIKKVRRLKLKQINNVSKNL